MAFSAFDPTSGEPFCLNCNDTFRMVDGSPCPHCEEAALTDSLDTTDEGEDDCWSNDHDFNDDMDGDFDSAMTSAGFGTDEDYGYYGDD
jgi:hypothetical protein